MEKNKIEFITQVDNTSAEDLFEEYYAKNIVPLVDEENHQKRVFRSRFWGYLWSACFLLGVNLLVVLFRRLMYNYPINFGQLFLVTLLALAVVSWPIISYYRTPKSDMFGTFVKFYGQWEHLENKEVETDNKTIVPAYDKVIVVHSVFGVYDGIEIEMNDTLYQRPFKLGKKEYMHTVSKGVMVRSKFNNEIKNKLLLFDKKGFRRGSKYPEMMNITDQILIPTATLFHIFTDDDVFAKDMLPTLFFERILDMKETFKASAVNIDIQEDYMCIYLENASMYFNNRNIWSQHVNKEKFVVLNKEMEQTLMTAQLVQVLRDAL